MSAQDGAKADAVVAESGRDICIKLLLAHVTGIPVLRRSFLDRSTLSASMCSNLKTHHIVGVACLVDAF